MAEVAQRLRCSPALVYALCADGKLPHLRLGLGRGTIRIEEHELAKFLKRSVHAAPKAEGGHIR